MTVVTMERPGLAVNQYEPQTSTITYRSSGELLITGPEHRARLAAAELAGALKCTVLITEAMPATVNVDMERAAGLEINAPIHHHSLQSLGGYMGHFDAMVSLPGGLIDNSLAKLSQLKAFDLVLDLGSSALIGNQRSPAGYFHCPDQNSLATALEELPDLVGEFSKPVYLRLNNDICAHSNSTLIGCTRCLEVCPADAISSVSGRIEVDHHLCHGVGGCASACPTGAIEHLETPPHQLLQRLREPLQQQSAAVIIRTDDNTDIAANIAEPVIQLVLEEINCAGLETWFSALAWGAPRVVIFAPDDLDETARSALQTQLGFAHAILHGLGLETTRISLLESTNADTLSQWLTSDLTPVSNASYLPDHKRREALFQAIDQLFTAGEQQAQAFGLPAGMPMGGLDINQEQCTLCMSCAGVCPTQALQSGGDSPKLLFTQHNCVQCGLCVSACPEKVLDLRSEYQLDPSVRKSQQTLNEDAPLCCGDCGKPFATQSLLRKMQEKLSGHSMFQNSNLLELCGDCRVKALMKQDSELLQ
ncbi:4Fe-4S binding protein [Aestuariirhabdus sp. Z084]|uniref:4Fe-4S dicluster domain-containing protein n=1 Tax=Aestuariirhabdus haliotis TaxID=2918751 RepID=UPI00201B4175|nr:4Fe-4S dicluster domain-containing protein [Aestuariirhabdus haliotis]MCL6416256.1 4Fe-4S binding protein [Aestuariirhabdus haliotis]MCL6420284.1 4Fe-4S binding protein [Aestuariirhabdus haliotis]